MPCTNGCVINSQAGGDHAYCECECHVGTLPAIPPSRERKVIGFNVPGYSHIDEVDNCNALRDEVSELKRKLAEVEGERDALRELKSDMLEVLNCYAWGIKTCGHSFTCICNQVRAEAIIAKCEYGGQQGKIIAIDEWQDSPAK